MEIVLLWFGLAIAVAVAATARGRNGFGWFLLAVVISPVLAALFLIAVPNRKRDEQHRALIKTISGGSPSQRPFEPDGVFGGTPYRVEPSGAVSAMMPGGLVKFRTLEQFEAATRGETITEPMDPGVATKYPQTFGEIRYRVAEREGVYMDPAGRERLQELAPVLRCELGLSHDPSTIGSALPPRLLARRLPRAD